METLRRMFDACDDDNDGYISVAQLRLALEATGLKDVDALLADFRTDRIAFDDFHETVLRFQRHLANGDEEEEEEEEEEEDDDVDGGVVGGVVDTSPSRETSVVSTLSRDEGFVSSPYRESSPLDSSTMTSQRSFEASGGGGGVATMTPSKLAATHSSRSTSRSTSREDLFDGLRREDDQVNKMEKEMEDLFCQLENANRDRKKSVDTRVRLQRENEHLVERLYHVEEQLRDFEKSKLEAIELEKKRRHADLAQMESEKNAEIEKLTSKNESQNVDLRRMEKRERDYETLTSDMRKEMQRLRNEVDEMRTRESDVTSRYKSEIDKLIRERDECASREESLRIELSQLAEAAAEETSRRMRAQSISDEPDAKLLDEIRALKARVRDLQDSNNELRAQFIQQGKAIIEEGNSLAAEMETASKDEIMSRVKEVSDSYARLRAYTEGLLLAIITKSPELLEKRT